MTWDKVKYLKEFLKFITDERYEPYDLIEEEAKGQYEFKLEEHKEEQKEIKKRKEELKKIIAKKKGNNIDKELKEYQELKETKFPDFDTWWEDTNNQISVSEMFWDYFKDDICNNLTFGKGDNKFQVCKIEREFKIAYFDKDIDPLLIDRLDGDCVKASGCWINLKTGKIEKFEEFFGNYDIMLLKKWINWKEDKKLIQKVFAKLYDTYDCNIIECNDIFLTFESGYDATIRICKNEWKIEIEGLNEENYDQEEIDDLKSVSDKNTFLISQL